MKVISNKANNQGIKNLKRKLLTKYCHLLTCMSLMNSLPMKSLLSKVRYKNEGEIIIIKWEQSKKMQHLLFISLHYLEHKSFRKFIKKDLYSSFIKYDLEIKKY